MMEVRFVKLIEIDNLLSDGKCSDEHAVASRITGEAVVSKFSGTTKFSILTTDAATDKFVSEHTVTSRIACESVVSERIGTKLVTFNLRATTNLVVVDSSSKTTTTRWCRNAGTKEVISKLVHEERVLDIFTILSKVSKVVGKHGVSERTATYLDTLNIDAATNFEVILGSGKLIGEHGISERTATDFDTLNSSATTNFEVISGGGKLVSEFMFGSPGVFRFSQHF